MSELDPLLQLREQIDSIDDKILDLLDQRFQIVKQVGELKKPTLNGGSIIRPGREASMVRRMIQKAHGAIPDATVAMIWRMIIAGAINIEESPVVTAYVHSEGQECYWLAREYFGAFTSRYKRHTITEIFEDLLTREATIAVLPIHDGRPIPWWALLPQDLPDVRVFARLPFVKFAPSKRTPIFAIGRVTPEASGHDASLWVFEVPEGFTQAMVERFVREVSPQFFYHGVADIPGKKPVKRFLFEMREFLPPEDPKMQGMTKRLYDFASEKGVAQSYYIGSYALQMLVS